MKLEQARAEAEALVEELRLVTRRCFVAGSVRRWKADVKDIEIVAVPKFRTVNQEGSLFPESVQVNLLHEWAMRSPVKWIKPGTPKIEPWPPKPDARYWKGLLRSGSALDLFIANEKNFGYIYLIRTGSKEFSAAILGYAKNNTPYQTERSYFEEHQIKGESEGYLVEKATGRRVETPTEESVFELLGLQYVEPSYRIDGRSIKRVR